MDIFFLIFIILVTIALLISNIYILAYYCHPDDKGFGSALICKIIVVLGMTLAWAQVLMLPLDVANNRSFGGGINMQIFWEIVYISTAIMVVIIIPSLSAYYECDPDDSFVKLLYFIFLFLV
jgi:LMBR1 domain-containing protein 1